MKRLQIILFQSLLLGLLFLLTGSLLLVGCASTPTTSAQTEAPTATFLPPPPTQGPIGTVGPTQVPLPPACQANAVPSGGTSTEPTIPPGDWTTFSDSELHYSISYPSNWIIPNGPCPGGAFSIGNFIPIPGGAGAPPPPPAGGFTITLWPVPNPTRLSPAAIVSQSPSFGGPPDCPGYTTQTVLVGGHEAILAACPPGFLSSGEGDPNRGVTYFISDGATMLTLTQQDLVNGQPSPILTQMVNSITFL